MMRSIAWLATFTWLAVGCNGGSAEDMGLSGLSGQGGGEETDGDTDGEGEDTDDGLPASYEPGPVALRRLLAPQYVESIRLLLGDEAADAADPPPDAALNGFTAIGATQLALGSAEIDRYEVSARDVAAAAMNAGGNAHAYITCTPTGISDAACMETFVRNFGRFAFRHALDEEEVGRYAAVGLTSATELSDFHAGVEATIAAMLQSPLFLYQVELGEPDPDNPALRRLRGTELATRISFFLTGATPDASMLDAAESGFLDDEAGVRSAATALIDRVQARVAVEAFSTELLHLNGLSERSFDPALETAMHEETRRLIDHVAFEVDGDFSEIFDADYTFVNDVLAAHYGIEGTFGSEFVQVALPPEQRRGGILGHAGVLAVHSHVGSTSPTLRGKFVRETLMCQSIPAPPPGVSTDLPVGDGTETMRERLEIHMTEPSCAGCHALMDPIGFALEAYDEQGVFRELDNGKPVNDVVDFEGAQIAGSQQLGNALRDDPNVATCLLRNLYRHATGHIETQSELDELEAVAEAFEDDGRNLKRALVEIVANPAFRVVGEPL